MSPALASGTMLGRYEIRSLLGAGGMGEVYRATDSQLGRDVAIKVLPPAFASDPERLRRFEQEARAAGTLNHPNILTVYDLGSREGSPYVVTELLDGLTLRDQLVRGALPQRRALDYARQIAEGLAAAHDKGILHRDLKPENLFVTRDGRVKILDFGLAKLTQPRTSGSDAGPSAATIPYVAGTEPGVLMGTVGYMAPEQVRAEPTDHRADIFSFGVVLYEMLTGRRAFQRDSAVETMSAILKEEPPESTQSAVAIAPAVERLLRRCLEKRPEARFQSTRDLAFAIDSSSLASAEIPASRILEAPPAKLHRRDLIVGGAALAATGAAAFFAGRDLGFVAGERVGAAQPEFHRLTFRQGLIHSARFAPDGRTVLYSAKWEGEALQLFSTRPESPESRPFGLPGSNILAISPSGELALMVRPTRPMYSRTGTLALMSMAGGAPREVLENVISADWSSDGTRLAIVREVSGGTRLEFPIGRVLYESASRINYARLSPTDDLIAFTELGASNVAVVDEAGRKRDLWSEQDVWGLAWSARGDEVWFSVSDTVFSPVRDLHAVALEGERRLVLRTLGLVIRDVAPDGSALCLADTQFKGISCLAPGESEERDLSWLDWAHVADISADGAMLLFDERSGGRSGDAVYVRRTDGSPAIRLGDGSAVALSPDGKWVLARAGRGVDLGEHVVSEQPFLLPTGAGEPRSLAETGVDCTPLGWFPDGKRLLVSCVEGGQVPRAYMRDLESGGRRALAPEGLAPRFRPSPDGALFVASDPDGVLWLVPVDGSNRRPVRGLESGEELVQWSADSRSLYVRQGTGERVLIHRLEPETGRRELWRVLVPSPSGEASFLPIVMTPDARSYAYTYFRQASDLYLVEGLT
jgi:hypothetical protein